MLADFGVPASRAFIVGVSPTDGAGAACKIRIATGGFSVTLFVPFA
jgi:hypothetical protein